MRRGPKPGAKQRNRTLNLSKLPAEFLAMMPAPKPPAHLSPAARGEWERTAPDFVRIGTLHVGTAAQFQLRCELVVELAQWAETVRVEGTTIKSGKAVKSHPLLRHITAARAHLMRLDARYFSPKQSAKPPPDGKPWTLNPFVEKFGTEASRADYYRRFPEREALDAHARETLIAAGVVAPRIPKTIPSGLLRRDLKFLLTRPPLNARRPV